MCPRAVDDPAYAEHGGLGVVDDRCRAVHAEHAVVVQGERPTRHLRGAEHAVAGQLGQLAQGSRELCRGHVARTVHDGHHEAARRLGGEAQVDVAQLNDLLGLDVDACVELGELPEPGHADPCEQRQQADAGSRVDGLDLVPGRHQGGRVDVDPGRDVRDLVSTGGHLVGDRLAHATQGDPYVASAVSADRTVCRWDLADLQGALDVGSTDHLAGAGGSEVGQVDSPVPGQLSDDR